MDQNTKYCPCCGRHCDLSAPHCQRGEEYARTGVIPEGHGHEDRGEHRRHGEQNSPEGRGRHEEFRGHGKHGPEGRHVPETDRYEQQDIDSKLLWNLRDLGHALHHQSEGKGSQKRILLILEELGAVAQSDLTRRLGIQPGSASEVLGKLEGAGLILRKPSETDRRTTEVTLTEAGKEKAAEAKVQGDQRHSTLFSGLTGEEKETLLPLLEKLNAAWAQQRKEAGKHPQHREPRGHVHHGDHRQR